MHSDGLSRRKRESGNRNGRTSPRNVVKGSIGKCWHTQLLVEVTAREESPLLPRNHSGNLYNLPGLIKNLILYIDSNAVVFAARTSYGYCREHFERGRHLNKGARLRHRVLSYRARRQGVRADLPRINGDLLSQLTLNTRRPLAHACRHPRRRLPHRLNRHLLRLVARPVRRIRVVRPVTERVCQDVSQLLTHANGHHEVPRVDLNPNHTGAGFTPLPAGAGQRAVSPAAHHHVNELPKVILRWQDQDRKSTRLNS